jgi:hypothetical protein
VSLQSIKLDTVENIPRQTVNALTKRHPALEYLRVRVRFEQTTRVEWRIRFDDLFGRP